MVDLLVRLAIWALRPIEEWHDCHTRARNANNHNPARH